MKSIYKNIFSFIALTFVVLSSFSAPVGAQASNANAAQGMQISPTRVELNAVRGGTYNVTLNVLNVTGSELFYTASVSDFNAADESGSPKIFIDKELNEAASIRSWVSNISDFTLKSRQSMTINAKITVPLNAEPGGHYGAILFSGTAPELKSTGVGLSASQGPLILIRVDGAIVEKAELASFFSANKDGKQSSFFENGPINFITRIKNVGNIHIKPVGNIEVRDMFGGIVKDISVNKDKSNVLPNSIRKFQYEFNKDWMFGRYTADLTLGYGTTGQAITNTITFWIIPYKIILAALFIIITVVYVIRRMIKVYNRRIIEKSKNENKNKKHTSKKD